MYILKTNSANNSAFVIDPNANMINETKRIPEAAKLNAEREEIHLWKMNSTITINISIKPSGMHKINVYHRRFCFPLRDPKHTLTEQS